MTGDGGDAAIDSAALLLRLDQLRREERLTASARVVAVIGHLIGTPLNVMAGRASLIRTNPSAESVADNAHRIEQQVERLSQRVRRLVDYFGAPSPAPEQQTLAQILGDALELYQPVAEQRGVTVRLEPHDLGAARINCALGSLSLSALLSLGARTTPKGQSVTLTVSEAGPRQLTLALTLPGVEVPPSRFERLELPEWPDQYDADAFEVLSICAGLARSSGGGLQVSGAPSGSGAVVRFECAYS